MRMRHTFMLLLLPLLLFISSTTPEPASAADSIAHSVDRTTDRSWKQQTPALSSSWLLAWNDEFSGAANTGIDTNNWLYDIGKGYGCSGCPTAWGTGEVESMSNSTANVYQDGAGHLVIKPIRDSKGAWTSARIETRRIDFQPPAGGAMAVEAAIQQPNISGTAAAGYWPAFWMLGAPFRGNYLNWPGVGEVDIMEDINGLSSVFGTLHCGTSPNGPCNEYSGIGSGQVACPGCQTAFHTYRVEFDKSITPQQIRWYLDGVNFFTVNASQVDTTTWDNATSHGFFVILDVAMGGSFPAAFGGVPTASTTSGIPMLVDYVRVYTQPVMTTYLPLVARN
jgi:beta-glucanase (GH16 family)